MANAGNDALSEGSPAGFSLQSTLAVLRKRLWMMAAIVAIIPTIVGVYVSKEPKIYEASATVVIEPSVPQYLGQNFKDVVDLEASWWSSQELLQTELRIISSHSQGLAVAHALCTKQVGRDKRNALTTVLPDGSCDRPDDLGRAASILQGLISVNPVKESHVVTMSAMHNDPEAAALIVNTAAQVYAERNLERRLAQSEGAATWLGDEFGDLTQQLNDAEHALIEFKKQNNVVAVAIEDQQNDLSNRRKRLSDELNAVEVKLIGVRAQRDEYAQLASDDPLNDIRPGIADSPVIVKLKELYIDQYTKLVELKGKYLDKHPAIVAQESRLDVIRNDLKREAGLLQKNVDAQFSTLMKQQKDLKTALDITTREALQLEQRAIEYNRLKRNFERLSKLSEQVGGRERETSLAGHLKTNNVRVLDAALVPGAPIAPNVSRAVGLASLLALLVALGLAFLLEFLDATVKTQEDVERAAGLVFLGLIPRIDSGKEAEPHAVPPAVADLVRSGSKDLFVLTHPRSPVAECCRAIRTNLLFMRPDNPVKTLLITSARPQEGKTTTAISLAITMAQSGLRVLLVDTDLRMPRLHKAFGITPNGDGVSRAILGTASVTEMIKETGIPNLYLLPCGALPPNPAELLHAVRFKHMISQLSASFDRVIFDSPPVGAVTDAAILARLTDGTVLVAKSGRTSRDTLAMARRQVAGDGSVNVLGCILNDLDLSKQGQYGYYYYSRYGYYSGYGDTSAMSTTPPSGPN
jgi:capsular exopolysaccharide synthesis family protein